MDLKNYFCIFVGTYLDYLLLLDLFILFIGLTEIRQNVIGDNFQKVR